MIYYQAPANFNALSKKISQAICAAWPQIWEKRTDWQDTITVRLISESTSKELNTAHRGLEEPTDVLSFPIFTNQNELPESDTLLGDIVICEKMCDDKHLSVDDSVLHGTLHLLGFDHETDEGSWKMAEELVKSKM